MRTTLAHRLSLLALLASANVSYAESVSWPEAISRLAAERYKAETCVALLKKHGNDAEKDRGRLAYADAKTDNDAVVAGLLTTLAQRQQPMNLPSLEARLKSSTFALADFCTSVSKLLPPATGERNLLVPIVTAAIEPLVKALSEAVTALWKQSGETEALTRGTIRTQLEAAKWPDFAEVKSAQ